MGLRRRVARVLERNAADQTEAHAGNLDLGGQDGGKPWLLLLQSRMSRGALRLLWETAASCILWVRREC